MLQSPSRTLVRFPFQGGEGAVVLTRYQTTGRIALLLKLDGGLYARISVNVPQEPLAEDEFLAKLMDEHAELRAPLLSLGVFEDTGRRVNVGYWHLEVWRLRTPAQD